MTYRLIALDVDGTLLNDQYEITETTKRTIREVHAQGAQIVLCTGRSPENSIPLLEELGLTGVLITHNGAVTVKTPGPELIHQFSFDVSAVEPLVRYARENRVHVDVCTAWRLHAERIGTLEAEMYRKYKMEPVLVDNLLTMADPVVKLTVFGEIEQIDRVEKDWMACGMPEGLIMIRSGDHFIDVMRQEASKGFALKQLAGQMKVDRSGILAMGNYYNDIDMIQYAGLGIAMDNSPEAVKQAADEIAASNQEEGVHRALQQYCLQNK